MENLLPIEFNNKRILTTQQLSESYNTNTRRISENFNANQKRYIENKHYYCLKGTILKEFKSEYGNSVVADNINKLYLWTEKGALLHAKSLNTDKAWEVYDHLVETYFRIKENNPLSNFNIPTTLPQALRLAADLQEKNEHLETVNKTLQPKAEAYDILINSKGTFSMGDVAQSVSIGRTKFMDILRDLKILQKQSRRPYQPYEDAGYFVVKDDDVNGYAYVVTRITPKGVDFIVRKLKKNGLL